MKKEELRNILKRNFSADTDRFQIIKEVEIFVVTEQSVGQEFVLRLLARIEDFQGMETLIQSLVRQVGLFPYLKEEILSPQFRSIILCDLLLYIDVTFWYLSIDLGFFWGSWFLHRHKIPHPNQWGI